MRRCPSCGEPLAPAGSWHCAACGFSAPTQDGFPLLAPDLDVSEGFASEAFAQLAELESQHFWFRSRNDVITALIRKQAPHATSMLEVGCGTGFVLQGVRAAFPAMRLAGGEASLEGLAVARRRVPDAELLQLDARALPFEAEWDIAGAFDVLEHLDEDEAALGQLARAVRPGGIVLVTVPQHRWLWSADDEYGQHRRRYTRTELVGKARAAGLDVVYVSSWMTALLPLMAISRRRPGRGEFDPVHELRQGRRVGAALERVLVGERLLIERGVSLPAGGSLVLVARVPDPARMTS